MGLFGKSSNQSKQEKNPGFSSSTTKGDKQRIVRHGKVVKDDFKNDKGGKKK